MKTVFRVAATIGIAAVFGCIWSVLLTLVLIETSSNSLVPIFPITPDLLYPAAVFGAGNGILAGVVVSVIYVKSLWIKSVGAFLIAEIGIAVTILYWIIVALPKMESAEFGTPVATVFWFGVISVVLAPITVPVAVVASLIGEGVFHGRLRS